MSGLRKIFFLLVIAMSLCVAPARAYAEDGGGGGHSFDAGIGYGVVLGPVAYDRDNVTGSHKVGYVVYANNRYDAACYVLGLDVADVNGITDEQRAKLSNAETGGDFYTFAQRAYQFGANTVPSWVPIGSNLSELFGQGDAGKVWAIDGFVGYPFGTEYQDAKEDMQAILDGEDISGGGSGGEDDDYLFEWDTVYVSSSYYHTRFTVGNTTYTNNLQEQSLGYTLLPSKLYVRVPASCFTFNDLDPTNMYVGTVMRSGTYNDVLRLYFYGGDGTETLTQRTDTVTYNGQTISSTYNQTIAGNFCGSSIMPIALGTNEYTFDGTTFTVSDSVDISIVRTYATSYTGSPISSPATRDSGEPVTPPSNWPDAPETVTPSPPSLPEPTSVTKPIYPTKVVRITNTYTADLQGILDAMDEHCQHLQDEIYTDLKNTFDGMTDYLGDEFDELKQYLHDLFEWLADELDFTVSGTGYSDSTVVSWLKKIWSKIGSGVNTRPVDPLVNTDGAWKWLTDLFAGFLAVLAEKGLELSGALHGLLDDLVEKFPFSVPWDVLALLALFTAEPVSPLIEFEIPMLGGTVVPVSIDLSNYDSLMAIVRPVELVAFGAWLLWLTPEVLKSLNVSIGGGD